MGGLVIDILIAFIIRRFLNFSLREDSKEWPIVAARVVSCEKRPQSIGCDCVEVSYTYSLGAKKFDGMFKEPFLMSDSAADYIRQFPEDSEVSVRVNPKDPEKSCLIVA